MYGIIYVTVNKINGKKYASGYDAERAMGLGKGSISSCLAGSCKTLKGYHWRKATPEECKKEMVYA